MRRPVLACVATVVLLVLGVVWPAPASAEVTSQLVNFDAAGHQLVRFDTDGNAVDAHDGQLARFGSNYYLYGTSYDCGYRWQLNSKFCGFKVYSSPDLVHWTDRGFIVPAYQCGGCFRPHILFDPHTNKYVLWTNDGGVRGNFRVYTSDSPVGPFTEQPLPDIAYSDCGWDFGLYQDPQTGRGYFVDTDCPDGAHGLIVHELSLDDLSTDGKYSIIHMPGPVESPTMFSRAGTYYIAMSDPTCGYCPSTGTGYFTAPTPLGPWTGSGTVSPWSIENGALHASGGEIALSAAGSSWSDYTFQVDATPLQTATQGSISYAQAGVVVRGSDSGNGYAFLLSNYPYTSPAQGGYVAFVKFQNGGAVSVAPKALPFPVAAGTAYHLAVTAAGSTISIAVNGTTVDTETDSSFATGKVGFREYASGNEQAIFDNVTVTAPNGTVLMSDDFSGDLSRWDAPPVSLESRLITTTSCGGQPSFVAPPVPQLDGTPMYLYGSDLWNGGPNEALANYFWTPLHFARDGSIKPIDCTANPTVDLAVGRPGSQNPVPNEDQSSGVDAFTTSCNISAGTQRMQTFTAGSSGTLKQVRFTSFQAAVPAWTGPPPDAPLTLSLATLNAQGSVDRVLARQSFDAVGWSPRNVVMTPGIAVTAGATYAVIASSTTTQGCYGVATSDANPYAGGHAASSTDGGQTFTPAASADLKFLTTIG
jgi:hypothetical protein